jgi:predicted RNA-binding Zn-ribbon protein involved in translation (DUF1610 family)
MKWDRTRWRLGGCPSCGGDLYHEPLADKFACLQCGRDCAEESVRRRTEGMPISFPTMRLGHSGAERASFPRDAA